MINFPCIYMDVNERSLKQGDPAVVTFQYSIRVIVQLWLQNQLFGHRRTPDDAVGVHCHLLEYHIAWYV